MIYRLCPTTRSGSIVCSLLGISFCLTDANAVWVPDYNSGTACPSYWVANPYLAESRDAQDPNYECSVDEYGNPYGDPAWLKSFLQSVATGQIVETVSGGLHFVDGVEVDFGVETRWHSSLDSDQDGLSDDVDPYPMDAANNTFYFTGGSARVGNFLFAFRAGCYAGNGGSTGILCTNGSPLPHGLLASVPLSGYSGIELDWGGGTFWIDGQQSTFGPVTYRSDRFLDSRDMSGDGIIDEVLVFGPLGEDAAWEPAPWQLVSDTDGDQLPNEIDPYPTEFWNNTFYQWDGGIFTVNGETVTFNPGRYGGIADTDGDGQLDDGDGDGLIDAQDVHLADATNNSVWWQGGEYIIDQLIQTIPGRWVATNGSDSDFDGIPDQADPYPLDTENWLHFYWTGGTWPIDGVMITWPEGNYSGTWVDFDTDGIPDSVDPYPHLFDNHSAWWDGGDYLISDQWTHFDGQHYSVRTGSDSDFDGIPDALDAYPYDGANGNTPASEPPAEPSMSHWLGGTFMISGQLQVFAESYYSTPDDLDGDGIPESGDPFPGDITNNSMEWSGGRWRINGSEQEFTPQWLATNTYADSDLDGLPNSIDPWPEDEMNRSGHWAGGTFLIDGEQQQLQGGNMLSSADLADCDADQIPHFFDPYPSDAWNNTFFTWPLEARTIRVRDIDIHLEPTTYGGLWVDTDGDSIPDVADPLPNDLNNENDSDGDGIPDTAEDSSGGLVNARRAEDANWVRPDGITYLQAYQNNLPLNGTLPSDLDSDRDGLSDVFEINSQLDRFSPLDAVDSRANDLVLNVEKAALNLPLDQPVPAEDYFTVTGHLRTEVQSRHDPYVSVAENDWDGDGFSNVDEVLLFKTDIRSSTSGPSDELLWEQITNGRCSATTLMNFATFQYTPPIPPSPAGVNVGAGSISYYEPDPDDQPWRIIGTWPIDGEGRMRNDQIFWVYFDRLLPSQPIKVKPKLINVETGVVSQHSSVCWSGPSRVGMSLGTRPRSTYRIVLDSDSLGLPVQNPQTITLSTDDGNYTVYSRIEPPDDGSNPTEPGAFTNSDGEWGYFSRIPPPENQPETLREDAVYLSVNEGEVLSEWTNRGTFAPWAAGYTDSIKHVPPGSVQVKDVLVAYNSQNGWVILNENYVPSPPTPLYLPDISDLAWKGSAIKCPLPFPSHISSADVAFYGARCRIQSLQALMQANIRSNFTKVKVRAEIAKSEARNFHFLDIRERYDWCHDIRDPELIVAYTDFSRHTGTVGVKNHRLMSVEPVSFTVAAEKHVSEERIFEFDKEYLNEHDIDPKNAVLNRLLVPFEIESRDRAVTGRIPHLGLVVGGNKKFELGFEGGGRDLGRYEIPEIGSPLGVKIYEDADSDETGIFGELELNDTSPPNEVRNQSVVLAREQGGIRFYTVSDNISIFKVHLYLGGTLIGTIEHQLKGEEEFESLIAAIEGFVAGDEPPGIGILPTPIFANAPQVPQMDDEQTGQMLSILPPDLVAAYPGIVSHDDEFNGVTEHDPESFRAWIRIIKDELPAELWAAFSTYLASIGYEVNAATGPIVDGWNPETLPDGEIQLSGNIRNRGLVAKVLVYWLKWQMEVGVATGKGIVFGLWDGVKSDWESVEGILKMPFELYEALTNPFKVASELYHTFKVLKGLTIDDVTGITKTMFEEFISNQQGRLAWPDPAGASEALKHYMVGYLGGYIGEQVAIAFLTAGGGVAVKAGKYVRTMIEMARQGVKIVGAMTMIEGKLPKMFVKALAEVASEEDILRRIRAVSSRVKSFPMQPRFNRSCVNELLINERTARSRLNSSLGSVLGDDLDAHHLIPWEHRNHPLVQKAARGGFNINNGGHNGVLLLEEIHRGVSGHPNYNNALRNFLDTLEQEATNLTDEGTADLLIRSTGLLRMSILNDGHPLTQNERNREIELFLGSDGIRKLHLYNNPLTILYALG